MSLCRCGSPRHRRHAVTDACLTPEDREFVRQVADALDMAEMGPWWHQAAGRDVTTPVHHDTPAQVSESARTLSPGETS